MGDLECYNRTFEFLGLFLRAVVAFHVNERMVPAKLPHPCPLFWHLVLVLTPFLHFFSVSGIYYLNT